jgi:hypothetical protein
MARIGNRQSIMIIVIQCAASKRSDAGHLQSASGKPVIFVANPEAAPVDPAHEYARPDEPSGPGVSWRQMLLKYNEETEDNPLGLCPAWQLYENKTYGRLVDRFGLEKVYILSAGWGLIRADFLTPYYDITYSQSAEGYKRRRKTDQYQDFRMVPDQTDEDIRFFGGKDYIPLFCSLTNAIGSRKMVFYNSARVPQVSGCTLEKFETTTRTNWHYECANAFLDGALGAR